MVTHIEELEQHAALRPYSHILTHQIAVVEQSIDAFDDTEDAPGSERQQGLRKTCDILKKKLHVVLDSIKRSSNAV